MSNPYRLSDELNINDFGNGTFGNITNPQKVLNNYAQVTAISQGGCRFTLANETVNGLAPIVEGAMILVQAIQKSDLNVADAGKFIKAKILKRGANYIVTDFPLTVNCDLTDGKINVEGKGGASSYRYNGLEYIGNAQNKNRLPLGEGHGSVFILVKNLTVNENTRVGATYSGLGSESFGFMFIYEK